MLRHALWNVNTEHGNTIMKISGSPICAYGHDFNPCILDERGNFVFFGPFLQYLSAAVGNAVKWTLENRSENPGIADGDMWLCNDPWIGATHQNDVAVMAPVFHEGELFCWVANTLHQWDLGGTAPGGFNPFAQDVFWEPPCIPPVKIVEGDVIRTDIEEMYLRSSRMPDLVRLDLRAEVTGCRIARNRILEMIGRYGAGTVKATMRKLQDDSEAAFLRRLDTIPDGTWTEEGWMEVALPGDRGLYKNRLTLTKEGRRLIFSNEGSAPQGGTLSGTFSGWKGAVVSMLASQMLFDQMFVIEGALRHCEFRVVPDTITCATRPAAVSGSPALTLLQSIGLGGLVISKMLATSSDEVLRSEVQSCMGVLSFPINAIQGVDQRGAPFSSFLLDPVGAALSALLLARRPGHRRLALGPAVDDAQRRGDRALLPDALPLAEGEARLGRRRALARRQRRGAGLRAPPHRRHQPHHDHQRGGRARAGHLRRLPVVRPTASPWSTTPRSPTRSPPAAACPATSTSSAARSTWSRRRASTGGRRPTTSGCSPGPAARATATPSSASRSGWPRTSPRGASPPSGPSAPTASCWPWTARSTSTPRRRAGWRSSPSASRAWRRAASAARPPARTGPGA